MWQLADVLDTQKTPSERQKGESHARRSFDLFVVARSRIIGDPGSIPSASCCRHLRSDWSSGVTNLRAASLPGRGLYLDPGLLGLGWGRLLLGAGHMGFSSGSRFLLDPGLLGLGRQRFHFLRGLLGSHCRFLWWHKLWLRLLR